MVLDEVKGFGYTLIDVDCTSPILNSEVVNFCFSDHDDVTSGFLAQLVLICQTYFVLASSPSISAAVSGVVNFIHGELLATLYLTL